MIRIGLTGMSGSGKSFVSEIFQRYGIFSVNSDKIVHELYQTKNACTEALAHAFGNAVLFDDFSVDRKTLAAIVFSSDEKLKLLNQTVHPHVLSKIDEIATENEARGASALLLEAPQLFESGLDKTCDYIVSVIANHQTRVERLILRDGITSEMVESRLSHQYSDEFFREHSDFCIENNGDDDLEIQVLTFLNQIGLTV